MRRIVVRVLLVAGFVVGSALPSQAQELPGPPPSVPSDRGPLVPESSPTAQTGAAAAAYPCPPLSGGTGSSQIYFTYTWINDGCPTPIRRGIYSRTGFGWDHIVYRRVADGLANHETSTYAQNLWAQALMRSGKYKGNNVTCHHVHYTTPSGIRRTMLVSHSHTNYEGVWGRKGILTAYWVSGHVDPC
jgi:hypothetical protein